ncbi:MAG TPA: HPF/RaiA family ribosome-associated protein [Nitrospiria bacterium]|jgi:ribosomal subunit interface protein
MKIPLQITVRNLSLSEAAEADIRRRVEKLESFCDKIVGCRVTMEVPHRHKHQGVLYNARIDITVPGKEIVVKREPHEDIYVSIRDAFNAARRQLQNYLRKKRGEVKVHEEVPIARVIKLFSEDGYGFLETPDGYEIYFHKNSVLNGGFENLNIGTEVRYSEEEGEKGTQASTVVPIKS